jgi:putative DNA primase/helicase
MSKLMESAVGAYAALGWSLMALPFGEKKSDERGWQDAPDDVPWLEGVAGGRINLAVRLGLRSGMLADVDLDTAGAVALAPHLLPPTRCKSGTDGRPGSHWWYTAPDGPLRDTGTARYASPSEGAAGPVTYAELRWTGGYTVLPPSFHPDGWLYHWEGRPADDPLPPPPVAWDSLDRSVREVAGGALLLECYPEWEQQRSRHHASLALAGSLLGAGWDPLRVERFVFALASAAGDEEADDRVDNVRSAADRLRRGEQLHGWPTLAQLAGSARVDRLKRFLGFDQGVGGWASIMGAPKPTNGPVPQGGGAPGASKQAPASTTTPKAGPSPPQPAPVISTAQAAQQATTQTQNQAKVGAAEVALLTAEAVMGAQPIAKDEGEALYTYAAGVYRLDRNETRLRRLIREEILDTHGAAFHSKGMAEEVLYNLRLSAPVLQRPDPYYLHVLNGRLNVLTGDLEPHHHRYLTTVLLPVVYDKAAACPAIDRFFAQVFPADAIAEGVPQQIVAMCACPVRGIDKAILLLGEGANGKGLTLRLVRRFVGDENTSTLSLQDIGDDTFGTADLRGSVLNLCYDLPSKRLEDSGDFKAIVSGEPVRAQRKKQPAFVFEPYCRLLFSANNLPESADVSHGYLRRWYIVPFTVSFDPETPAWRPGGEILAELFDPGELSGLLNAALPWMRRFLAGEPPVTSASMDEEVEEFHALVDPFPLWVRQQLQSVGGGWVETAALIEKYRERAERRGRFVPLNGKAVGKAIKEAFPHAYPDRRTVGGTGSGAQQMPGQVPQAGKKQRGWGGVSWRLGFQP